MSKFSLSSFKQNQQNQSGAIGTGLLNSESLKAATIQKKTEYILYNKIHPNPRNEMSMSGIDELASQIKLSGLEQPLVVYQREDGEYTILTGHRRFSAIGKLIDSGDWNPNDPVECKVKDLDEMDIPLDNADKEMLSILVTNQTREKTDGDKLFEIIQWKGIIKKLREQGINYLVSGFNESGEPIQKNISGVRTQQVVAEQMGISNAQVGKFNKVINNGSPELLQALKNNNININNASNVASMPQEKQKSFITETLANKKEGEQITTNDVNIEQKKQTSSPSSTKKKNVIITEEDKKVITEKSLLNDIKSVRKFLKNSEEGIKLTENQYADYCRYINGLKKIFN